MEQNEIRLNKNQKKAIIEELSYLTYDAPYSEQVIKRIIELVHILASDPREVIPKEFEYENFIKRFYELFQNT